MTDEIRPDEIFVSVQDGDWDDPATWARLESIPEIHFPPGSAAAVRDWYARHFDQTAAPGGRRVTLTPRPPVPPLEVPGVATLRHDASGTTLLLPPGMKVAWD